MEGMKQKDISNLKAEDIAAYDRQIDFAKQFPEGSEGRQNALFAARDTLQGTRDTQKYGERADSNPFTYKKGRYKDGGVPAEIDTNIIPDSIINGKDQADYRMEDRGPSGEELDKGGREQREESLLRSRISGIEPERGRGPSGEGLDKGGREQREEDLLRSRIRSAPRRYRGLSGEELDKGGKKELEEGRDRYEFVKQKQKEDMADRFVDTELNKSLHRRSGDYLKPGFDSGELEPYLAYEDESNREGRRALKKAPPTIYKTYSEKEAEKLSEKDDYRSAMDRMSDEADRQSTVKKLKGELSGYRPDWSRSKEDKQLLLEDRLLKEEALKREHARTGGPDGQMDYKGSLYKPFKSKLRKRIEAKRKAKGGILASS